VYDGGDVAKAESMYQDVIKGAPLALESVEAYVNLAMIQRTKATGDKNKNQDEAMKNLRRALAIDAQSMAAFTGMAYLYLDLAEKDKNKLTLAEVVCVQATKIDGSYGPIYNVWGLLKMRQGEIIDALKYFEKAYTLEPKMFEAYMNFGSIAIGFRGYEDARNVFSRAVELKPDSYEARINLGVAKRGLEDFDGAEAEYTKAIDIDKTRPEGYFDMGVLYQDYRLDKAGASGYDNFVTAIDWYKKFTARASGSKEFESFVSEAQKRIKDSQKAIDLIKEAATLMKEASAMTQEQKAAEEKKPPEGAQPGAGAESAKPAAEGEKPAAEGEESAADEGTGTKKAKKKKKKKAK
jgi:Tfp pilus assembly protein PilF